MIDPVELTIDGNVFSFKVLDNKPLTVTYKAYVQGEVGDDVVVNNKVSYYGNAAVPGTEAENKVKIAKSMATIEGPTEFHIIKRDKYKSTTLLAGTEYTVYEVGTDASKVEVANSKGIVEFFEVIGTNPDTGVRESRVLSDEKIYAFKETKANDGYLIDNTNKNLTYVAFKRSVVEKAIADNILPKDVKVSDVNIIQSNFAFERTNEKNTNTKITFEGRKTLENANYSLTENEYEFTIAGPNLKNASGQSVDSLTVGHDANGNISFPEIRYELKELNGEASKTYEYTIKENAGTKGGIVYSEAVYNVTVTVSKNDNGTLKAEITNVKKNGEAINARTFDFVNKYAAEDVNTTITGLKETVKHELKAEDYTFQIKETTADVTNPFKATVKNDANGYFTFVTPMYTLADHGKTFTYEVSEVKGDKLGITYDETVYTVNIKVTDDKEGNLQLEKTIANGNKTVEQISFTNSFEGSVELTKTNGKEGEAYETLAEAKFELYKANANGGYDLIGEYTTGEEGVLSVDGLAEGSYYFVEIKAPAGYSIATDAQNKALKYEFNIEPGSEEAKINAEVTVENEQKLGSLSLVKKDKETSARIAGATFVLYKDGNAYGEPLVTDENGKIEVKDLPWGKYHFVETVAAPGYVLDETPTEEVTIDAEYVDGKVVTVEKTNKFEGSVVLTKTNGKDGDAYETLEGAVFNLYKVNAEGDEELIGEYTTGEEGVLSVDKLAEGSYYFVEIKAPAGYSIVTNDQNQPLKYEFKIGPNGGDEVIDKTLVVDNKQKLGTLVLAKTDVDTQAAIQGVEFVLYKDGQPYQEELFTDENGKIEVESLPWGDYHFVEISAPEGYIVDGEKTETITIDAAYVDGEVKVVGKTNKFEGSVMLTKTNGEEGEAYEALAKAEFELYKAKADGGYELIGKYTTGEEGVLSVDKLAEGSYYFLETKAPIGYSIATDAQKEPLKYEFNIGPNSEVAEVNAEVEVVNEQKLGSLSLVKKDETKTELIKGATFALYKDGEVYKEGLVTDENGKIEVKELPWGEYHFVETAAAPGYIADDTATAKVVINAEYVEGEPVTVEKTNEKKVGSLSLIKKDVETSDLIEGATFALYKDGELFKEGLVTDKDGKIEVKDLAWGEYYFVETAPAPGYVADATPTDKVVINAEYVEGEPVAVDKTNEKKVGSLSLIKKDVETSDLIEGAKFDLYKDGEVYKEGFVTDANGKIEVKDLPWGEYYFVETAPAPGYVADATPTAKVVINAEYVEGEPVTVEKTNEKKVGSLSLIKKDVETSDLIEGATFALYKDGGLFKEGLVTDKDGKIEVKDLAWGEYYFVETAPAPGYVADATPTDKVVINAEYVEGEPVTVDKTNEKKVGSLSLIKKDADTAEVIEGAKFDLYKDGEVYEEGFVTDANGKIVVENLPWGEYYFMETAPAPGYVADATPTDKVVIDAKYVDASPITVEKTNKQTEFYITKTDINGEKYLTGSTVEIFKVINAGVQPASEDGATSGEEEQLIPITSWTSDGSNHLIKGMLEVGETYIIKETAAPTGYGLLESYIEFTVNEDGSITSDANFAIDENGNRVLLVQDDIIDLKVTKTDYVTGKNLEGAVLAVFDKESGEEIVRWTSTKEGHYDFGAHLTANKTYILKELQAPEGYEKIDDVVFKVLNEGQVEVVTESELVKYEKGQLEIGNCPIPAETPDTGDHTPLGMSMILMTLAMIGMVSAAMPRKRRSH